MPATYLRCAQCGDVAAEAPADRAFAHTPDGEPLCSALCRMQWRFDHATSAADHVAAMREALLEDPAVVEAVRLTVVHESDAAPTFRGVLEGPVLEVDADGVTTEHGPDGEALNVPWRSVVDAAEAA
jgi:hypothetical protein